MQKFIMTIGLPASGKDHYFENYLSNNESYKHISSDAIRELVFGDVNDQTHNGEVFEIMRFRTKEALKDDYNVYYNATNLSAKRRMGFLKELPKKIDIKKIALVFVPPYAEVLRRNSSRSRVVPPEVIERMYKAFQVPTKAEGWDEIQVIGAGSFNIDWLWRTLKDTSHDNPHHSKSIGDHMIAARDFYKEKYDDSYVMEQAILYHDIGKLFTKTFRNYKGEVTDIAHFYGHENVGAYMYLSARGDFHNALEIAALINHHMDFFKGEKYMEKVKNIYGQDFIDKLTTIHEADVSAH